MQTLQIFEDIEEGTLRRVSDFIREIPDGETCTIECTSHGGLVFYGNAIFQKIQEAQSRGVKFKAKVYGVAASSAADIVLVCDEISMASTASIMIHSAWNAHGDEDEGIRIANSAQLSVIRKRLPEYSENDLRVDRWFTAREALNVGLIDSIFDVEIDSEQARLCAKYLATYSTKGGNEMAEEIRKEEVMESSNGEIVEEEVKEEEIKREDEPSIEEILERIVERLDEQDERLRKIEEMNGECGDRRDNARLRAVFDKISAIAKPCVSPESLMPVEKKEDPKAALEKHKAKYPTIDRLVDCD